MAYFQYHGKKIYYEEIGTGTPLLLLHGNTASSKMFSGIVDLYKGDYQVILIDFLGHGKSDRIARFPVDFWYDEAMQAIALIKIKDYHEVNIIGTSGGAIVALNIALEESVLINKVIADSFEGEKSLDLVATMICEERERSKQITESVAFWQENHGNDWVEVVDHDTEAMLIHHQQIGNFFHQELAKVNVPVMLTASRRDEFTEFICLDDIYNDMYRKIPQARLHFFEQGGHPAMMSNAREFAQLAKEFFDR